MACGMGGMRTAGDLVAWMQLTRKMKIVEAKRHVAAKLGISTLDLSDETVMREIREKLRIGCVTAISGSPKGVAAKYRISELLDITIPSVNIFKAQIRL